MTVKMTEFHNLAAAQQIYMLFLTFSSYLSYTRCMSVFLMMNMVIVV